MKNLFLDRFFIFFCVSFFSTVLFSQEKPKKKLKVGLVLSGGGVKGFSHIGVLEQIEKAGISLDMIGGTSIGGIVGGLYASGYSPKQIANIFKKIDSDFLISNTVPRKRHSLFSKSHGHLYFYGLGIYKWGIQLPIGISKGQNAYNFLKQNFQHVDSIKDFSKLKIPFYCVATNLETGRSTVFDKGNLVQAIRASGSFPTLFEPVEIGGQVYIDGGVANNFPVEEMKRRGMDVIIGVDVQGTLYKRNKIKSVADMLNQIIGYNMYRDNHQKVKRVDVYIRPEVVDYGVTDFSDIQGIIDKGTEAAAKQFSFLKAIAKKQNPENKPIPRKRKKTNKNKTYKIGAFAHNFIKNHSSNYLLGTLQLRLGDEITLSDWINKLHGIGADDNFGLVQYDFIEMQKNNYLLKLNLKEKSYKNQIKFGLMYDPLYKTGLLINLTFKSLLLKNDLLSTDFILGDTPRGELNYYVNNGFFISYGYKLRYNHFQNTRTIEHENGFNYIHRNFQEVSNLLYIEKVLNRKYALQVGLEYAYIKSFARFEEGKRQGTLRDQGGNYLNFLSSLTLDTYNRAYLPQSGFKFNVDFRIHKKYDKQTEPQKVDEIAKNILKNVDIEKTFLTLNSKMGFAHTKNNFTLFFESAAGFYFDKGYKDQMYIYYIGGPYQYNFANYIPFYELRFSEETAASYLKLSGSLRYALFKKHDFSIRLATVTYLPPKTENVFKGFFQNWYGNVSLNYTYWSLIGPASLTMWGGGVIFKLGYTF